MSKETRKATVDREIDRSPVIALLLAQYRGIQTERIVLATSMRVLWFALLVILALVPELTRAIVYPFIFITISLFFVSSYASHRTRRLESSIRGSLVRLDPALEDYYIRALHDARDPNYESPIALLVVILRNGEDVLWLLTAINVLAVRYLASMFG